MLRLISIMFIFSVLIFFVFLFIVFKIVKRSQTGVRHNLAKRLCPACGKEFGDYVAERAEKDYLKKASEMWKQNSDLRYRLTAIWPLKCDKCDWVGTFEPAKKELLAENVVIR